MNWTFTKSDGVFIVVLLLAIFWRFGPVWFGDKYVDPAKAPSFERVIAENQYQQFMLVFDDRLPGDGTKGLQNFSDGRLSGGARTTWEKWVEFGGELLEALFWAVVARFLLPWIMVIVGALTFISALKNGSGVFSSLGQAGNSAMVLILFALILIFGPFMTDDSDMTNQTLDRYKQARKSSYYYKGDIGVTFGLPSVTFNTTEVTDSNANKHTYIESLNVDINVNNALQVPLLMGAGRCQIDVNGQIRQYAFPLFSRLETGYSYTNEVSDYLFLPAASSGTYRATFGMDLKAKKITVDSVHVLGCTLVNMMADKAVLVRDENSALAVRYEPGYLVFTNYTSKAIKTASVRCLPLKQLWGLRKDGYTRDGDIPDTFSDRLYIDMKENPLRANTEGRYAIHETRPQVCSVSSFITF